MPVIERAIEAAALMLGTHRSRGYGLEMICADFLAGASIDGGNPEILLQSIFRYYQFLPGPQQEAFLSEGGGRMKRHVCGLSDTARDSQSETWWFRPTLFQYRSTRSRLL
jgi:hypothetical protein